MKDYDIQIPNGTKYLNEVMTCLPEDCIFDKSIVGCGGTTVALTCPHNYIICVPFVSLIQNKMSQHSNLFGLYKGASIKSLKEYLETNQLKKIMVTYDSLPKLLNYLDPKDYKLLIDEYHLLFNSYSFRSKAVQGVLNCYTQFQSYCFMTATLIEKEYLLKEVQHLPIVTARWDSIREITVYSVQCEADVIHTVAHRIEQYLNGEKEGNAYFFVNSVEFIKSLVEHCKLTDKNTRAIWSINNIKTKPGIKRSSTTDSPKKINFMTSTVFEGSDLYDEDAHIYIISDGRKAHTLVDISTSFTQIAHRVRNTKYWDRITHIYQQTRYSVNLSFDEYKAVSIQEIDKTKRLINEYQNFSEDMKTLMRKKYTKEEKDNVYDGYIRLKDGDLYFDENMAKIDLYNFKVTKSIYKLRVNLKAEYEKEGMKVKEFGSDKNKVVIITPKKNFKEVIIECQKGDSDFILQSYKKYPFLHQAIVQFGYDGIEKMNYQVGNIKRKLIANSNLTENQKLKEALNTSSYFYEGNFVSFETAKNVLKRIYEELKISKTPKAKDIENFYLTKPTLKKNINGYIIIKKRIL